jgi:hypothetical protein
MKGVWVASTTQAGAGAGLTHAAPGRRDGRWVRSPGTGGWAVGGVQVWRNGSGDVSKRCIKPEN